MRCTHCKAEIKASFIEHPITPSFSVRVCSDSCAQQLATLLDEVEAEAEAQVEAQAQQRRGAPHDEVDEGCMFLTAVSRHEAMMRDVPSQQTVSKMEQLETMQLTLFAIKSPDTQGDSNEERFINFHRANTHVFSALYKLAKAAHNEGWKRGSINLLFERLRWSYALQTKGGKYKLSNSLRAYYARAIMEYDARLKGFFVIKSQDDEYSVDLEKLGLVAMAYKTQRSDV